MCIRDSDIPDSVFKKHARISKKEIKNLIKTNYEFDKQTNSFRLKILEKSSLDKTIDLTKFIIGTITGRTVYDEKVLRNGIIHEVDKAIKLHHLKGELLQGIKKNLDDIIVCMLCFMHDTQLRYYNKLKGKIFLSLYAASDDLSLIHIFVYQQQEHIVRVVSEGNLHRLSGISR